MKRLFLAILAAALSAAPGAAADLQLRAPAYKARPALSGYNWTRCYVGADVGYAWLRDKDTETVVGTGQALFPSDVANARGPKLGGYAGCNLQTAGSWVFGIEGDAELAKITGTALFLIGGGGYDVVVRSQESLRGRVGWAFDRSLLYVTGGVAFANIRHWYINEWFHNERVGGTVGAGFEYALPYNLIGRIEYRYSDFGRVENTPALAFAGFRESHRISENTLRAGLAYSFGGYPVRY
jgi:outer membrane immunogenic protein